MTPPVRSGSSGFTVVEVLVALVLFALIGTSGFAMLDQVLRTQRQTEGRLERLAELQRAMLLISADFAFARAGSVRLAEATAEAPTTLSIRRSEADADGGTFRLRYALQNGILERWIIFGEGEPPARQHLVSGVAATSWRFTDGGDWTQAWPPKRAASDVPANPRAVELTLTLTGSGHQLRRVMLLPADPR